MWGLNVDLSETTVLSRSDEDWEGAVLSGLPDTVGVSSFVA